MNLTFPDSSVETLNFQQVSVPPQLATSAAFHSISSSPIANLIASIHAVAPI
jgi:hypothetical protein